MLPLTPKIFIISGTGASGKDSIIKTLQEKKVLDLHIATTTTTRPMRKGEKEGNPYYFISKEKFQEIVNNDGFFEYEKVCGNNFYGMRKIEIEKALKTHKSILWQIDYRGFLKIKKIFKDQIVSIFILPPSLQIMEQRMRKRGDKEIYIKERLKLGKKEMTISKQYDYQIINHENKLQEATEQVIKVIEQYI